MKCYIRSEVFNSKENHFSYSLLYPQEQFATQLSRLELPEAAAFDVCSLLRCIIYTVANFDTLRYILSLWERQRVHRRFICEIYFTMPNVLYARNIAVTVWCNLIFFRCLETWSEWLNERVPEGVTEWDRVVWVMKCMKGGVAEWRVC